LLHPAADPGVRHVSDSCSRFASPPTRAAWPSVLGLPHGARAPRSLRFPG
jgi:hypothetical protein